MSTDRKRLTSAIQRIAREDPEIRKMLDDFRNSGGKPGESATTGSGAEDRQICCDGSTGSNPNPGSDTRDPSANAQDGLDPDDPAKISDNLTEVSDCATGTPIRFMGSQCIPPSEGAGGDIGYWEDCQTYESGFSPGYTWEARSSPYSAIGHGSPAAAAHAMRDLLDQALNADWNLTTISQVVEGPPAAYIAQYVSKSGSGLTRSANISSDEDPSNTSPPPNPLWPENGAVDLYISGGKIVGSKFDPENDGSYSKPRDSIQLCDNFGNSFDLSPSASGGWKTISAQNPGDGYLYNSSGKQIARISGSEYSDPKI